MPIKKVNSKRSSQMKPISTSVPLELWRRAQKYKVDSDMTLEQIVAAALDAYLPKEKGGRNG